MMRVGALGVVGDDMFKLLACVRVVLLIPLLLGATPGALAPPAVGGPVEDEAPDAPLGGRL
jgi:hypothetical protein